MTDVKGLVAELRELQDALEICKRAADMLESLSSPAREEDVARLGSFVDFLYRQAFEGVETVNGAAKHRHYVQCKLCHGTNELRDTPKNTIDSVVHTQDCLVPWGISQLHVLALRPAPSAVKPEWRDNRLYLGGLYVGEIQYSQFFGPGANSWRGLFMSGAVGKETGWYATADEARASVERALADALPFTPAIPPGWQLVPKELSAAQVNALAHAWGYTTDEAHANWINGLEVLAAAPSPQTGKK